MSLTTFSRTIDATPRPSFCLLVCLVLLYALACVAVSLTGVSTAYVVALICLVLLDLANQIRGRYLLKSRCAITRLQLAEDGEWKLTLRAGTCHTAKLLGYRILCNWMIIAVFQTDSRKTQTIIIMRDAVAARVFRQLLVQFRLS
ncbi:MAG: hypothetical protein MJA83_12340 [Gammaproteobacteria bacterium]|nr:hypothetical protein [Gammaproteobacteria bacterium]